MSELTTEDVYAAHYAKSIREEADLYATTARSVIEGTIDSGDPAEDEREVEAEFAYYQRGAALLDAGYQIVYSERGVVGGDRLYEQVERHGPVSPIVAGDAGYIATNKAVCYMALVR